MNFTPTFNDNYIVETNFDERLKYFKNKEEEKRQKIEKEKDLKNQTDKGQKFFSPKLIAKQFPRENNTNTNSSKNEKDIYENMYSYARKYNQNKNYKISNQNSKIKNNFSSVHTCYDSENILKNLKKKIFLKIFSLLDSDQDNLISKLSIDLKKIPQKIKDIFKIIIKEIIEDDHTLNKDEFLLASEHLYELISFDERKIVLNFLKDYEKDKNEKDKDKNKNKNKNDQIFTFKVLFFCNFLFICYFLASNK
jgi:hypothetical protein